MRVIQIVLLLTLSPISTKLLAQSTPIQDTGTFSNMYYSEEGGDAIGEEIRILKGGVSYWVLFQYAEGPIYPPVLVQAVVKGSKISFKLPPSYEGFGEFSGTIHKSFLVGKFSEQPKPIKLKRGKSYWD